MMPLVRTINVVVEGPTDAALLRPLLGQRAGVRFRFYAAGGSSSLATLGRNLLVHEGDPLVLVMDSDTRSRQQTDEAVGLVRLALRNVAPAGSFEVFAFVPEIEVIYFEAPDALEELIGQTVSADDLREGLLIPKETLARLALPAGAPPAVGTLIPRITPEIADRLAAGKQASALRAAVDRLLTPAPVM